MDTSELNSFYTILVILGFFILLLGLLSIDDIIKRRKIYRQLQQEKEDCEYGKLIAGARLQLREQSIRFVNKEIFNAIANDLYAVRLSLASKQRHHHEDMSSENDVEIDLLIKSMESITNIGKDLEADIIREEGLLESIQQEKLKIEKFYDARVDFKTIGEPVYIDIEKELVIFSIIQEAFNKALSIGKGALIKCSLSFTANALIVEIANHFGGFNNSGFFSKENKCKEQHDIVKRAALLNGWCVFDERRNNTIVMQVPY